ncbi:MAG: hypothetical protein LC720_00200, partial [Actinobacteria bacterium]|nr:hypothetical protein [Actinomycetota bacterium]
MAATQEPYSVPGAPAGRSATGPRAGFWQRFGAYLLDGILLAVVNIILTVALHTVGYILALVIGI